VGDSLFGSQIEHPGLCVDDDSLASEATAFAERTASPEMRARAYLVAARAQADRFALSGDPEARRAAVGHYQAALAVATPGRLKRSAWTEGWRLAAGLAPVRLRFMCYTPD
jgi:hypothetical protein